MLHANFTALSSIQNSELLHIKVYLVETANFALFFCCDLDLDLMTFLYEVDPYTPKMYPQSKNELCASRLSKVIALHTYRQYGYHQKHYSAVSVEHSILKIYFRLDTMTND